MRNRRTVNLRGARRAITLIEILIVVVILGILAAIVVPQFVSAASESRENSLKMNLFRIRQQIAVYKEQHNGNYPTLADFEDQMELASDGAIGTSDWYYNQTTGEFRANDSATSATY